METEFSISRDAFDFLLNIVEQPRSRISGAVLHSDFPHLAAPLTGVGWLVPSGEPPNMMVDGEGDVPFYELEWDAECRRYRYFAGSLGWIYVDTARLQSYVVDVERFLTLLKDELDVPRSHRITCLHEGLLWHLGPARLGSVRAHVYFARCLANPRNLEPLRRAMRLELGKTPAAILHGGRTDPTWMDLPTDQLIAPLRSVYGRDGDNFAIDEQVLAAIIRAQPAAPARGGAALSFSTDYRTVYWYGKKYSMTKKQADVVECLVNEGDRAHRDRLAAAAGSNQTLEQIMRNRVNGKWITHPLFGTLIRGEGNGSFVLDREASPPDD